MAINLSYGFYNSRNGDRKYDANEMSRLFNGIICDGVFQNVGSAFDVTANVSDPDYVASIGSGNPDNTIESDLSVMIGSGRAWFNGTWSSLNEDYPLVKEMIALTRSDEIQDRWDAIVLQICKSTNDVTLTFNGAPEIIPGRTNRIIVRTGIPAEEPVYPSYIKKDDTNLVYEHVLAYVKVPKRATYIRQSDIKPMVGTKTTPFVAGAVDTSGTVAHWSSLFNTWLAEIQDVIDENAAANLLTAISSLSARANMISGATRYYYCKLLSQNWLTASFDNQTIYYQDVTIEGMTSNFVPGLPVLESNPGDSYDTIVKRKAAIGCLTRIETHNGYIRFYCYDKAPKAHMNLYVPGITDQTIPVYFG